jgi:hypothetical protein
MPELFDRPDIEIKDLVIEAYDAKHPGKFNPERDLTQEDYTYINNQMDAATGIDVALWAGAMGLLFPGTESAVALSDKVGDKLVAEIERLRDREIWVWLSQVAVSLRVVDSERLAQVQFSLEERRQVEVLIRDEINSDTSALAARALDSYLLFPDKLPPFLGPDFKGALVGRIITSRQEPKERGRANALARMLVAAKFFLPYYDTAMPPTEQDWEIMQDELISLRSQEEEQHGFIRLAMDMAVLAADKVILSETEFKISFDQLPTAINPTSTPLPKVRKF